jgi:hypothetical protein
MSKTKVKVRYIGNKPIKRDTVCQTLTIWTANNDVAEVDDDVAIRLVRHPSVWVMADSKVKRPEVVAPAPELVVAEPEIEIPDGLMAEQEKKDTAPVNEQEGEGEPVTVAEVTAILSSLDKDKDFSAQGRPLVDSIRDRFPNRPVTSKEVKAAWELFTAE